MNNGVPTFVKWAGGKSQLLGQYGPLLPSNFKNYFEPFLGSGAVFFYVKKHFEPEGVLLSDSNEELINAFIVVRDNVGELIVSLNRRKGKHSKRYFYDVRKQRPAELSEVERASRFIYLNKTCYNGLYRVNSKGQFNVPFGDYKSPTIFDMTNLREASKLLKGSRLKTMKFDSIYREKSTFATIKILDHLKSRLDREGIRARLSTEEKSEFGRYDVVITQGTPCLIFKNGEKKIRLEIKASLGLPLEQVERYLWDPSPLILVRVITGQVVLLKPSEMGEFVRFSTSTTLDKAQRVIGDNPYTVPGPSCYSCLDAACQFNKRRESREKALVKMSDADFGADLRLFFANLPYVTSRTADFVVQELRKDERESPSSSTA